MKFFQKAKLFSTLIATIFLSNIIVTNANAAVLGHVETQQIGYVIAHAVSPDGKFVYSITIDTSAPTKILVHSRDPETGKFLAEVQSLEASNFISGVNPNFFPQSMVVSPDSKQVYISTSGSVLRFDVGASGALTYNNRVLTDGAGYELTITTDGKFMYAGSTSGIATINRASNGNITFVGAIYKDLNDNELEDTRAIMVSPDGKNLYASSTSSDQHLYVFDINQSNGKLTSAQTFIDQERASPAYMHTGDIIVPGAGGTGTAVTDDGKFFYSVGGPGDAGDSISVFNRSSDGSLSFSKNVQAPLSAGVDSLSILFGSGQELVISPDQKYIYTFSGIMQAIGVWERDANTGDLSFLGVVDDTSPVDLSGASSAKIETSADGRHLYINTGPGGGIVVFDLRADMSVVKTDATDPVEPSGTIQYTLGVTNNAPSDAQNVVVVDTLPAGTSFVSGTVNSPAGSCSASGQVVTCTMGRILANDGYNAVINVTAPTTDGTITNSATVSSDQLDTNTANDTDTETTTIASNGTTPSTPSTPSTGGGGGSLPWGLTLLLILPALLRRRIVLS